MTKFRMKYIVVDDGMNEVIVVFPELLQHNDVAKGFPLVVSGGFIDFVFGKFRCHGKSTSLGLEARREDAVIANRQLAGLLED